MSGIHEQEIRDILLRCYNESASEIKPLGGYMSKTFLARTNMGRRVLKVYGKACQDRNKIVYSHELTIFLNEQGFPAVKLLRSQSGETLIECTSGMCALFDFAQGDPHDPGNLGQLVDAGRTLGDYHRVVADFSASKSVEWPAMKSLVINGLRAELAAIRTAVGASTAGPADALYVDTLQKGLDETERSLAAPGYEDLPTTVIHGDWRAQNMKFEGDRVSFVLDFDFARPAERLFDICYALVFFPAIIRLTPPTAEEIAAFLRAYGEVNPLAKIELRFLPDFLRLSFLRGLTLWLRIYYLDRIRGNSAKWIRHYLPMWDELDEISESIAPASGVTTAA